ncbi:YceK/YidQ family lipoprotein [Pseudomonas purpurea]|uniref:YceK/YidQ family lipoprotein n=1 Tax=Pseudomonas purpurea TaxID=3136737 RepID=UPI003264AD3B
MKPPHTAHLPLRNSTIKTLTGLLTLCAFALSGCGTLIARGDNAYSQFDYYKGTRENVQLLTTLGGADDVLPTQICWMTVVCPVIAIFSLPVDVVVDTVLLPYDASNG